MDRKTFEIVKWQDTHAFYPNICGEKRRKELAKNINEFLSEKGRQGYTHDGVKTSPYDLLCAAVSKIQTGADIYETLVFTQPIKEDEPACECLKNRLAGYSPDGKMTVHINDFCPKCGKDLTV